MSKQGVTIAPVQDAASIQGAADTLSRAFSGDPLITWLLKPDGRPWGALTPAHRHFQFRRVQSSMLNAKVMRAGVEEEDYANPYAGVVILHPPVNFWAWLNLGWSFGWLLAQWRSWADPVASEDIDLQRLKQMGTAHHQNLTEWTKKYPPGTVWYLEAIVSDLSARGTGVGGALMRWILQEVGESPCFLECTDSANVPFYEKYGFTVVGTSDLVDGKGERGTVAMYWMLLDPKK